MKFHICKRENVLLATLSARGDLEYAQSHFGIRETDLSWLRTLQFSAGLMFSQCLSSIQSSLKTRVSSRAHCAGPQVQAVPG